MSIKTIISSAEMRQISIEWRLGSESIAFVPTMGALHEGHIGLVKAAKSKAKRVVVSIFVNPLQFGPNEDFAIYPRTLQADTAKLAPMGIDALFLPNATDMYPSGFETYVVNNSLSNVLCGQFRPDHFRGVLTVVAKLFHIVQPDFSLFGKKDYQQCHMIRKMVQDLFFPIEVIGCPTLRESDGLAMSSRNTRLSVSERQLAPELYRAMQSVDEAYRAGKTNKAQLLAIYAKHLSHFPNFRHEYAELRNCKDLAELGEVVDVPAVLITAAHLGSVRLIDNLELSAI